MGWMKYTFIVAILLPLALFPAEFSNQQEIDSIEKQQDKFFIAHTKIDINNIFLNSHNFIETKVSPFFKIENFYMAFDFSLRIDTKNGGIDNIQNYTKPSNYLQFIQTFGYGLPKDPFFLKVGTLTDLSIGQGLLVSHFRNDLFLPDIRQLGLYSKAQWNYGGFELFTSNIENFGFGGVRAYAKPLDFLEDISPFKDLEIGASFVYDIDTLHTLYGSNDQINLHLNPQSEKLYAYSVDTILPLYKDPQHIMKLGFNLEQAGIINKSQYSVLGKFWLEYNHYELNIGLAYLNNGFHMNMFSALYFLPQTRAQRTTDSLKENMLGYMVSNQVSFFEKKVNFFLDIYGQSDHLFSYDVSLELKPFLLSSFAFLFTYIKEDMHSFMDIFAFTKEEKSFILLQVSYLFADNTKLALFYRKSFRTEDNVAILHSHEINASISIFF